MRNNLIFVAIKINAIGCFNGLIHGLASWTQLLRVEDLEAAIPGAASTTPGTNPDQYVLSYYSLFVQKNCGVRFA